MSGPGPSFDQRSFVHELDDVVALLKTTLAGHEEHVGWTLRSTGTLTCGCGAPLYAPHPAAPPGAEPEGAAPESATPEGAAPAGGPVHPGGGPARPCSAADAAHVAPPVVRAPKEVDIATADAFSRELSDALATGAARIAVDFAETTFCDSTALRLLVNAAKQAEGAGRRLVVVHPTRQLLLMADLLGASRLLGLAAPSS